MEFINSLADKVAIITGSRRGIGKAIALAFASSGANVVVSDVVGGYELEEVVKEIQAMGRRALAVQADASKKEDVEKMVRNTLDEFGKIDILVNCAGVFKEARMLELSEEDWDKVMDINLKSYFLCCQAVGKEMVKAKKGVIINMASRNAEQVEEGRGLYCISKAGVVMLTRILARELGRYNIRVNAIGPGMVETEMTKDVRSAPNFAERLKALVPLERSAKPEEIASIALFLATEASSYITGHMILADGGRGA
ncbi:MAG: 3-oxoacyl-[acyl-carrier protein] reductase [Thermoanaerobacteraceae bacterium]|nr:3-oxoacyl-[acyl-carrier protein] reductase [Thermoanaerobacteraceae bacterium]RKL64048.1 3-oxoacyl-ACP reductase FabG [Thermoanaerobacteraceae bacterium SP2]